MSIASCAYFIVVVSDRTRGREGGGKVAKQQGREKQIAIIAFNVTHLSNVENNVSVESKCFELSFKYQSRQASAFGNPY
jgi:hypothetical protein